MPPPATKKRKTTAGATRRTTRSQKPLLSIEMIGKVGSFANYDNGDLMNICKAVGPKDAGIVRYTCLKNNDEYLWRITRKNLSAGGSGSLEKAKEELSIWMKINTDWTKHCKAKRVNDDKYCEASTEGEGETMMIKLNPRIIFNNPAVAIGIGRLDILKHLVEDIGIDINSCRWSKYTSPKKYHLLVSAAYKKDKTCFDYLIARTDIDACANFGEDITSMLWQVFFLDLSTATFKSLISHRSFDPNRSFTNDEDQRLPLHYACFACIALCNSEEGDHFVTKTKILLDAGADPQLTTESLSSPLDDVAGICSIVGERSNRGRTCKRLTVIMEEKVAAGK